MTKKQKYAEAVAARLQGKRTIEEMQQILNDAGAHHMKVIDENTIEVLVDNDPEFFHRNDEVNGQRGSGLAFYGSVMGDHRMIAAIYEDIHAAFELLK